ncbi:MAG: GtrA family protein [Acetobacteraceae bacterium]
MIRGAVGLLPVSLQRLATDGRIRSLAQFAKFGAVGIVGLAIDTATVYALRGPAGLYGAGVAGYFTAASSNWLLNRVWTFRGQGGGPAHRQWARFLVANALGFVLNRGTYALLVTFSPLAARHPVIAVAAGAVVGMVLNFELSRRMVFR